MSGDFDPNAPLPDWLYDDFVRENKAKQAKESKKREKEEIDLPENVVILGKKKQSKKGMIDKAQEDLKELLQKNESRRTSYGTVVNDKMRNKGPSMSFNNGER